MLDWEVQFHFHVHGHGKDLFGDGFAFWYARDRNLLGYISLPQGVNRFHFSNFLYLTC